MRLHSYEREDVGCVRQHQEDSHGHALNTPNGDVFVTCDGMGGHVGGKMASTIAVDNILEFLKQEAFVDPKQALCEALHFANTKILEYAETHPNLRGMGTTACVALFQSEKVYIAHVGDSRIYLYCKGADLHRITKDHSYVQSLVDKGEISDEEAEVHPNKNRITRALGSPVSFEPEVESNPLQLKEGDTLILCSDGLCGMLRDVEIESIMATGMTIEEKGSQLIEMALNNGGLDNVTVQLIEVIESACVQTVAWSYNPIGRPQAPKGGYGLMGKSVGESVSCATIVDQSHGFKEKEKPGRNGGRFWGRKIVYIGLSLLLFLVVLVVILFIRYHRKAELMTKDKVNEITLKEIQKGEFSEEDLRFCQEFFRKEMDSLSKLGYSDGKSRERMQSLNTMLNEVKKQLEER